MNPLYERAKSGDKDAERQLFTSLRARFAYLAKQRVGNAEEAKDLAQEACVTILEKYRTESFRVSFAAWAHGVLRMKIGNFLKRRSLHSEKAADLASPIGRRIHSNPAFDPELEVALVDCFRKVMAVNRRYARALNLSHQGFPAEEIARRLSVTCGNFYSILNRGRLMLERCLRTGEV